MPSEDTPSDHTPASVQTERPARPLRPAGERTNGWRRLFAHRFGGVCIALAVSLAINAMTRIALTVRESRQVSWDASLAGSFFYGTVYDLAASLWWLAPMALVVALVPRDWFTRKPVRVLAHVAVFAVIYLLFFGAVSEGLFWDEFGVRFNFIAVDYLVYTTEVLGNIRESYSMPAVFGGILFAATGVYLGLVLTGIISLWLNHSSMMAGLRWRVAGTWCALALITGLGLSERDIPAFANSYNRELAKNGLWSIFAAFRANQLEFDQFYRTMPVEEAFTRVGHRLHHEGAGPATSQAKDLLRQITHPGPERRLNVVQITGDSLSAAFLSRYGNPNGITPSLDKLAGGSLVFDRFYATGTRTDRGMEALTLSVPPTPGRSLVKRPDNSGLFTLGSVFRSKGYNTAFIYGGFGYFDNMNAFFGGNGYRVVDRNSVAKEDITFANAWGACDEDLYRWALREADRDYAAGKPFFHFVMTTSNHRPYTFPEGRIDLPSKESGRNGAVKYSDFAIGEFFRQAADKPWFKDTIFVIVGDHCASSAGKTALPVENYHVPLLVYSPGGQVASGVVTKATSQIDYAPTLLGLLQWSYPSRFFGRDVLSDDAEEDGPLFIGTYQKLGMYRRGALAVLQPVRQSDAYDYDRASHALTPCRGGGGLVADAIANYQAASWLFKHGVQREYVSATTQP